MILDKISSINKHYVWNSRFEKRVSDDASERLACVWCRVQRLDNESVGPINPLLVPPYEAAICCFEMLLVVQWDAPQKRCSIWMMKQFKWKFLRRVMWSKTVVENCFLMIREWHEVYASQDNDPSSKCSRDCSQESPGPRTYEHQTLR